MYLLPEKLHQELTQVREKQESTNSRGGIAIEDLDPADLSQLKNSPWWLQNKA